MISRRHFLQTTLTSAGVALASRSVRAETKRPPNIVFILGDDWGWGDLACYGHPNIKTPHLDQLAREGILFTQAYASSPVCSPTRAALLTGQYGARLGIHSPMASPEQNQGFGMPEYLDPACPTITGLFQKAGYAVGHFGKWHLGGGHALSAPDTPPPTAYGIDQAYVHNGQGPGWEVDAHFNTHSSELTIDKTIAFIEKHRERPFYVQTWLKDPHAYLDPTEEMRAPYAEFAGAPQTYYSVITNADRQIGRLLDCLRALGLEKNTLVIFTSDNGPEDISIRAAGHSGVGSTGPFRGRKRSLYEGGIRVPLLVRWPAATPAATVDNTTLWSSIDFLPSLCALAGIPLPANLPLDGEDLSSALRGQPVSRKHPLFWEFRGQIKGPLIHHSPWLAVREGSWKLLLNPDLSRIELYHLEEDPAEVDNRAREHPERVRRLQDRALAWQAELPNAPVAPGAGKSQYPWP